MSIRVKCLQCDKEVGARITNGQEIYPHRPDLYDLTFAICDTCGEYKSFKDRLPRLIPSKELREMRVKIHATIDPLWQSGKMKRKAVYAYMRKGMGWAYHTEQLRNVEEANKAYKLALDLSKEER